MNSNLENLNLFQVPSPLFNNDISPYLSPLFGSVSSMQQNSHD